MRRLLPLPALLFISCAQAPPPAEAPLPALAGQTILAGCRQGECGWLKVIDLARAGQGAEGELRRIRAQRGTSLHPDGSIPERAADARIEWQAGERSAYAFCSTARPAYAFENEEGELITHYLDPFDLGGYQYVSAGLYMRLCHGLDALPEADRLRALGYRPGTRSEQVEGGTPDDLTRF